MYKLCHNIQVFTNKVNTFEHLYFRSLGEDLEVKQQQKGRSL